MFGYAKSILSVALIVVGLVLGLGDAKAAESLSAAKVLDQLTPEIQRCYWWIINLSMLLLHNQ
ncbi:hypothetical protein [Pseudomonas mediterranea]|uniref:hypothetical protein n=1 Tax=Pseudomonas mediterranea TaxID=183795 RepID=UPI00191FCCFB|nr:hypothetical protein [Pseudomonas mediterranea]